MSDYEIIGRITVWIGAIALGLGSILGLQYLAWWTLKEIVGWPRIWKALRLLQDSERGEG